jgi:hypothetical protein
MTIINTMMISYQRALSLLKLWNQNSILFCTFCELQIAGAVHKGWWFDGIKNEYKNQQFFNTNYS